jgi:hypothetical protein
MGAGNVAPAPVMSWDAALNARAARVGNRHDFVNSFKRTGVSGIDQECARL